jgi:hypothetical protein
LIDKLKDDTGFDMKALNNIYHVDIKTGKAVGSRTRKYSEAAVALLKLVHCGASYEVPKSVMDAQPKPKSESTAAKK